MYKSFLKYCKPFRYLVKFLFGLKAVYQLHIPFNIYSDSDVHYLIYDENGDVVRGTEFLYQALKVKKGKQYGISVLYDRY